MSPSSLAAGGPVIVYLADDLSGANSSASLLYEAGLRAVQVLEHDRLDGVSQEGQAYIVNLASRDAGENLAGERLYKSVGALKRRLGGRAILWGKRLDSTLRGHLVPELRALKGALPDHGPTLVAPAFPRAGRVTVGGYQLINPWHKGTVDAFADAFTDAFTDEFADASGGLARSYLPGLLEEVGYCALSLLSLYAVRGATPPAAVTAPGKDEAVVADALSDADLKRLASWTYEAWLKGAVVVDSGPYLAQLVKLGILRGLWPAAQQPSPVLVVLGSRSAPTEKQVAHLCRAHPGVLALDLHFDALVLGKARAAEVLILTADARKEDIDEALEELAAAVVRLLTSLPAPYAFVISGGRTASSVLSHFTFRSLEMRGEIFPLVPVGRLSGGQLHGSLLVTKGGLVGGPDTLTQTVKFLKLLRRLA